MFPKLRATLAFLLLCLLSAPAAAATVSGTVSSATTNLRLEGKVVAAYDATGTLRGSATTDIGGSYVLTLPGGSYRLLAYDPLGTYATGFYNNAESFETSELVDLGPAIGPSTSAFRKGAASAASSRLDPGV